MCGFVGLLGGAPLGDGQRRRCRDAVGLLRHRGPDHVGARSFDRAELAHARLSVVDPSPASHQPVADATGRWWCVHNGEIYNFPELRRELEGRGARFATRGDAEVILEAYKAWGTGCQRRFNGMWAFAVYDRVERRLFLSRDRCGVRPLYLARLDGGLAFASEMKALLALGADPAPDWPTVSRILVGGIGDDGGDATVFRGVRALPPGHELVVTAGGLPVPRRWWVALDEREAVPSRYRERVELLRERLGRSVGLRLRSDVPTGVALSGGLDSSTVYGAACAVERDRGMAGTTTGRPLPRLRAFTVSNPGSEIDERRWVDACVARWGRPEDLEVVVPDPDRLPDAVEEVVWHQEAPVWSPTVVAVHELYRRVAASGTRVLLEGHGADELLGGYVHHARAAVGAAARAGRPLAAWRAARCWQRMRTSEPGGGPDTAMELLAAAFPDSRSLTPWRRGRPGVASPERPSLRDLVPPAAPAPWAPLAAFGRELDDPFERTLYLDVMRRLPSWFRVFDRASTASAVESRVPFTDPDVVHLALSLPPGDKVAGISKRILRDAAAPWLPRRVRRRRPKQPFAVPWRDWLGRPAVRGWVLDLVRGRSFIQSDILDGEAVARRVETMLGRGATGAEAYELWPVLNLFLWHRRFSDVAPRGGGGAVSEPW